MADSVSVVDVARRAGVSVGTVSNVLNRPDRVSPPTRGRVLAAIEELGFVRNEAARQLRAGRGRTIGLIVLDVRNPFFTDLAAGVEAAAADEGLSVVLCDSGDDPRREERYLSLLQEQRAYGILITPVSQDHSRIGEIRQHGTPVVLVDRAASGRQCSVSVNDPVGGELAAAHLLALGHRRIAFIGGPLTTRQVADRLAGARHAVAAAGLGEETLTLVETSALNVAAGRQAGERVAEMAAPGRPTAVFCANDLIALGVLQEMTRRRLKIPEDLAIVGYDNIDFAAAAAVPLTSVAQPRAQLGQAAAELLIDEVAHRTHRHRQVVFEPDLVVRESTQP
ncbi:LacI family DNA-binding transcriptional regulator [Pseudofrankia sp. DC12]|uniref:LacI family DNA-binding transcriptional regulator n=1 Tax=Pseudofrankia sp. DC12 TaxID=683315 RepID=UPI0005F7C688|nr:LacI family DNA-binding transcriptional regulator [Pseudofrankia sp. DC12]